VTEVAPNDSVDADPDTPLGDWPLADSVDVLEVILACEREPEPSSRRARPHADVLLGAQARRLVRSKLSP
jgi:hypothetical protein